MQTTVVGRAAFSLYPSPKHDVLRSPLDFGELLLLLSSELPEDRSSDQQSDSLPREDTHLEASDAWPWDNTCTSESMPGNTDSP